MVRELLTWLSWVDAWAGRTGKDTGELRDRRELSQVNYRLTFQFKHICSTTQSHRQPGQRHQQRRR